MPQRWLDLAVRVTAQRNYQNLTRDYLSALKEVSEVRSVFVYEVFNRDGVQVEGKTDPQNIFIRSFSGLVERERPIDDKRRLHQCITKGEPVVWEVGENARQMVFPLQGTLGPHRLVVVEGESDLEQQQPLLERLVHLYRNLVALLDEKERDQLTGLLNRQTFDYHVVEVMERLKRGEGMEEGNRCWLAVMDIDHFKRVNDRFGHLYGDEVLLRFAQIMKQCFRHIDHSFRFGGEEFVLILSNTDQEGAHAALERFRRMVEEYEFPIVGQVTVSIGYVDLEPATAPSTLIDHADGAMYQAKQQGRNQVIAHQDSVDTPETGRLEEVEFF
jgi:diguanylate cyclase (GGDEF)-like protein